MKRRDQKNHTFFGLMAVFVLFLSCIFISSGSFALDYRGRIDTKYDYKYSDSDNASDKDIYQYHSLDADFTDNFSFEWFGGLRKDLDEKKQSKSGTSDSSDVAFRGLPDAANKHQNWEYRIYTGLLKYNDKAYGASLGRTELWDYEFSTFDGGKLWAKPVEWLKLEGFAGKPWSYGYYKNYSHYYDEDEFIGGGGAGFSLLNHKLNGAVRYFNLQEKTEKDSLIGESSDTYISNDNFTKANLSYAAAESLKAYISSSMINSKGRSAEATLSGYCGYSLITYRLNYYRQFIDIEDFGDKITQFSYFMTAYHPYQTGSLSLTKSLADVLNYFKVPVISDVEIEGSYQYRAPVDKDDGSRFNPRYQVARGGIIVATHAMYYLNLFYENILSYTEQNDIQAFGGEITKKWKTLRVNLGSAYYAHKYEATYSDTVMKDSFYAREYYMGIKWLPLKSLEMSVKASYEKAKLTSLTDTDYLNQDINNAPMTETFAKTRDYMRVEVKLGYIF